MGDGASAVNGRYVKVTSAQRRAAAIMVERSKKTGRPVSPSVQKIADAKPVKRS